MDSDAHDEGEDFEASKMKEFNSLLSDIAKREPLKEKMEKEKVCGAKSHR